MQLTMRGMIYIVIMLFLFTPSTGDAVTNKILKVGVVTIPPLGDVKGEAFTGIAVDNWRVIANKLHILFQFVDAGQNPAAALLELKDKQYDVVIGPINITAERMTQFYFTYPFFYSPISVAVIPEKSIQEASNFVVRFAITLILPLFLFYLMYILLLWICERDINPDIPKDFVVMIKELTWKTLLSRKSIPVLPQSFIGRIAALVWMFIIFLVLSTVPASITTLFLAHTIQQSVLPTKLSDITDKTIAIEAGSFSYARAMTLKLKVLPTSSFQEGVDLLKKGQVYGVINSRGSLSAILDTGKYKPITIAPLVLGYIPYGFAFHTRPEIMDRINQYILTMQVNGVTHEICQHYMVTNVKDTSNDCLL